MDKRTTSMVAAFTATAATASDDEPHGSVPGAEPSIATRSWFKGLVIGILGLSALTGCGGSARLDSLVVSPRLTFDTLKKEKVALLPVAAKTEEVPFEELKLLDGVQANAFDTHAHGLGRVSPRLVAHAIRTNFTNWDTIVRFADTGISDREALEWLSSAVGARYLIFTRVEYAEIANPVQHFEDWLEEKYRGAPAVPWASRCNRPLNYHNTGTWDLSRPKRVTSTYAGTSDLLKPQQISSNRFTHEKCTTSKLIGIIAMVDAKTGSVPWSVQHHVTRDAGNTLNDPRPSRLAWTLFSEAFAALPGPG